MKHPAAPLLAPRLGRLQHTNDRGETGYIFMPGFNTSGMSTEQAEATNGPLAQAICEGVIETLGALGYQVIAKEDIKARARELAAQMAAEQATERTIHCNRCRTPLYQLRIDRDFLKIDATTANAVNAHFETCR